MNFRFLITTFFSVCLAAFTMQAQTEEHSFYHDAGFTVGVNAPMYKDTDASVTLGLTYGNFYDNGLGFRTGIQYTPEVTGVKNSFGIPVAFAYRTGPRSRNEKFWSAVTSANNSVKNDRERYDYDEYESNRGSSFLNGVFVFLVGLVNDLEFTAGLTPGYVAGETSSASMCYYSNGNTEKMWTERLNRFALSLDAGVCLNYNIWRFDLKVMPAFHYSLTDNYVSHKSISNPAATGTKESSQQLKWFFTFSGGLTFNF